jgi:hypothetical protein
MPSASGIASPSEDRAAERSKPQSKGRVSERHPRKVRTSKLGPGRPAQEARSRNPTACSCPSRQHRRNPPNNRTFHPYPLCNVESRALEGSPTGNAASLATRLPDTTNLQSPSTASPLYTYPILNSFQPLIVLRKSPSPAQWPGLHNKSAAHCLSALAAHHKK